MIVGAVIPALTFLPLCRLAGEHFPASSLFSQSFTTEICFWAHAAQQYIINLLALTSGFFAFLLLQYGLLFSGHRLLTLHPFDPLRIIIAINFVPLMSVVAVIATFTYRRTGRYLPGAFLCALLVTWYMVVGQATQGA